MSIGNVSVALRDSPGRARPVQSAARIKLKCVARRFEMRNTDAPRSEARPTDAVTTVQLRNMVKEDSQPFATILQQFGLRIGLRLKSDLGGLITDEARSSICEAPIHTPDGNVIGAVGLIGRQNDPQNTPVPLLQSLIDTVARSVSERWFRIVHRRCWILAIRPQCERAAHSILAVDEAQTIVGADHAARRQLRLGPSPWLKMPPLNQFFAATDRLSGVFQFSDIALTLSAIEDDEPWVALLTSPYFRDQPQDSASTLLHARPRQNRLITESEFDHSIRGTGLKIAPRFRAVEAYVEANLDRTVGVEDLARLLGMSASSFSRAFHSTVKLTPHRYVMWRRLVRARELIETSNAGLAEVAVASGFADQSHLCRCFQQWIGVPPSRLRRQNQ